MTEKHPSDLNNIETPVEFSKCDFQWTDGCRSQSEVP